MVWRIYSDKPDASGAFQLVREDRGATPNIVLPPGGYVIHASLGLVSMRERASLAGGSLRIGSGRDGGVRVEVNLPLAGNKEDATCAS